MDGFGRAISEEASVFSIGDGPFDRSDRIGPK
jgi:hypothetical protein